MRFKKEGYSNLLHTYIVVYENDHYELHLTFRNRTEPTQNPQDCWPVILRKDEALPYIVFSITRPDDPYPDAKSFVGFGQETPPPSGWRAAKRAIQEMDEVIREMFPGFRVL